MSRIAAALTARAEHAADKAVDAATRRIARAIGADYTGLSIARDIDALRISGRGLGRAVEGDVRMRAPELWLGEEGDR